MIEPRYVLSTPTWDEHVRWVDQRVAQMRETERKRRQRGRRT